MSRTQTIACCLSLILLALAVAPPASAAKKPDKDHSEDPYADFVWPPPPDEPRIKLEAVYTGRADLEATSKWKRRLIGASPQEPTDRLRKPYAVAFDSRGRLLVTDWATAALVRFDRIERRYDVLGTRGAVQLKQPLGVSVGPDDTVYVADVGLQQIVAFGPDDSLSSLYGRPGELTNPTDAAVGPDAERLFVTDSKAHQVVVFDLASGELLSTFGERGEGEGQFNFPSALAFSPDRQLLVVDQINGRVQAFDLDGTFVDAFGELGTGFGSFARPKDVVVDEVGFIYVTDNAFNNVQIFDADFSLLTFVGETGRGPGRFHGASGIAVRGAEFAIVDQLGQRLQIFRFLVPKDE